MGYAGKVWQKGEVLVADTMFFLEGYHTDKTQVYFAGSKASLSGEALEAFAFCRELLQAMADRLKPGAVPAEIYDFATGQAGESGWSDGFMGLGENKVPFVGHGIGLFVDDFPPLTGKLTEPLQESTTLALEPKIGLPGLGMVGVEDTFVVTPEGGRSLSGEEREIICIEGGSG
jgi:Xaa-Pro aminopeptidase